MQRPRWRVEEEVGSRAGEDEEIEGGTGESAVVVEVPMVVVVMIFYMMKLWCFPGVEFLSISYKARAAVGAQLRRGDAREAARGTQVPTTSQGELRMAMELSMEDGGGMGAEEGSRGLWVVCLVDRGRAELWLSELTASGATVHDGDKRE
jgi:hypothetical protein